MWLYHSETIESRMAIKSLSPMRHWLGFASICCIEECPGSTDPKESSLGFCTRTRQHHVFHWVKTRLEYALNTEKGLLALIYSVCQGFLNKDTERAAVAFDLWRWMQRPSTGGRRYNTNPKLTTYIKIKKVSLFFTAIYNHMMMT